MPEEGKGRELNTWAVSCTYVSYTIIQNHTCACTQLPQETENSEGKGRDVLCLYLLHRQHIDNDRLVIKKKTQKKLLLF